MTPELPEWPKKPYMGLHDPDYLLDMVAFWESRCRLAVKTLNYYSDEAVGGNYALTTIKDIGPLPKEAP